MGLRVRNEGFDGDDYYVLSVNPKDVEWKEDTEDTYLVDVNMGPEYNNMRGTLAISGDEMNDLMCRSKFHPNEPVPIPLGAPQHEYEFIINDHGIKREVCMSTLDICKANSGVDKDDPQAAFLNQECLTGRRNKQISNRTDSLTGREYACIAIPFSAGSQTPKGLIQVETNSKMFNAGESRQRIFDESFTNSCGEYKTVYGRSNVMLGPSDKVYDIYSMDSTVKHPVVIAKATAKQIVDVCLGHDVPDIQLLSEPTAQTEAKVQTHKEVQQKTETKQTANEITAAAADKTFNKPVETEHSEPKVAREAPAHEPSAEKSKQNIADKYFSMGLARPGTYGKTDDSQAGYGG